jgi:hypothetical protein
MQDSAAAHAFTGDSCPERHDSTAETSWASEAAHAAELRHLAVAAEHLAGDPDPEREHTDTEITDAAEAAELSIGLGGRDA